ncbi:MAG: carotenoid 1,2-hydratase [Candidatus Methylumidiphilus alinenensis]|uniref:Carotenoid 1,2-hydratase n=1 Tax=Candidatus Methylumidiphilus alinenensis TaxID=2202197 RepID=A0A2W4SA12_9GAMM|nr:MAG: carotenoid 1,2-hydratase [Candidatus Methylumidiphilus alinenensis]
MDPIEISRSKEHSVLHYSPWLTGIFLALSLAAYGQQEQTGEGASATLREPDHAGFERAFAPRQFEFPADHGPHPDFRDEWWYVTGNLDGPQKQRFGFQITFFRHGLKHGIPNRPSRWAGQDANMAHFALTDVDSQKYTSFQRISRSAIGLAGEQAKPFKVWLDDWRIEAAPGGDFPWHFRASQDGIELDLELDPRKPPVLNGDQGLSQKSSEPGNASYYYSITRMTAKGQLKLPGQQIPVNGLAWLDREWSTSMLAEYQAGWDWFSLQFDDGTDLMFFRLRHKDGKDDPASSGALVAPDGQSTRLFRDAVAIETLDYWESPAGGRYPASWRFTIKPTGRILAIRPVLADQEFRHDARYWEGAVDVLDAKTGKAVGRGYVELTGYAPGKVEKSGD